MSTIYHTPIVAVPNQLADAALWNSRFSSLDTGIDDAMSFGVNNNAELAAARSPYASLDERLDAITFGYVGGNIATLTNGAASAGQKVVTVDSTTGFLAGAYVAYELVGGTVEYNTIDTIDSPTQLTLDTNIGTGGIADNSYIGMISVSEYQAANAIPHGTNALTLPLAIQYANGGRFHVAAYGAYPGAAQSVNTAGINAAISDAKAAGGGTVQLDAGTYAYDGCLDLCDTSNVHLLGAGGFNATVLECHNTGGAAIEIIGSNRIRIEDIEIVGHATDVPAIGIWTGRSTAPSGSNTYGIWCERVFVNGSFTLAAWYNNGCESVQLFGSHCYMTNATCKAGVMHDWENTAGTGDTANALTPEHATISIQYVQALGLIFNSFLTCADTAVAFSPVYIVNETGYVHLRDTYVTAYGKPMYYMLGTGYLVVHDDYVEGTPTYIVHGDYHAGDSNNFTFHLSGCSGPASSSGSSLYFDDDTTVNNSLIERSNYIDDLRFSVINASRIEHWCDYAAGVNPALVVATRSSNCYFEIEYADTYSNADPKNTTIVYNSDIYGGYTLLPGLAVDTRAPGATAQAVIRKMLFGTKTWTPSSTADGAMTYTDVTVTGALPGDMCIAEMGGAVDAGMVISTHTFSDSVRVTVFNKSGGAWNPGEIVTNVLVFRAEET